MSIVINKDSKKGGCRIDNDESLDQLLCNLKNNKECAIKLFEKIFEITVEDIIVGKIEHFNSIKEYKFSVLKIYILYNKNAKQEISIKIVKRGKIKESIFCYWSLLYEEYINESKEEVDKIPKTTVISQETEKNSVILKFNPFIDYYAKIDLIELETLPIKNKEIERWVEDLKAKKEDILFIGRKKVLKNV